LIRRVPEMPTESDAWGLKLVKMQKTFGNYIRSTFLFKHLFFKKCLFYPDSIGG
jgi:hypothetical protein